METIFQGTFFNPTKGTLGFSQAVDELVSYMKENSEKTYEVIVGCDSSATAEPTFPLVMVVLRRGEGGRFFLQRVRYPQGRIFHNLHDRILQEVLLSCELALELRNRLSLRTEGLQYEFEYIHADIGRHGKTKDMIREVTGLIRGNGFEPRIKPESFAASSVADRFS